MATLAQTLSDLYQLCPTCGDQRYVVDEAQFCWGCWDTLHLWDEQIVAFRDRLHVALGPTVLSSHGSLGDLKHQEFREAGRLFCCWARSAFKKEESKRMPYNAAGADVTDDISADSSVTGSQQGSGHWSD